MRTRCGTLATMPRTDAESSSSTIWLRRVKPRPLMTSLCLTGVQIFERKYCSLILAVAVSCAMVKLLVKANFESGAWGRAYISSTVLPRSAATSLLLRSWVRASKVALTTLCGLAEPSDLVRTFCTPAEVMTARTVLPAITPVPSGAGFSITQPAPKWPSTWCGIVVCVRLILNRFFLAASIPLRMAWGTSLAFPEPYPTTPSPGSPTTTSAANDMFLPPLTTLVTRLIETTSSFRLSRFASNFFLVNAIMPSIFPAACSSVCLARPKLKLKLQTSLTGCIGQSLHPAVVQVSAAIEDNLLDALLLRALCNQLADRLRGGHVSAVVFVRGLFAERGCRDQGDAVQVVDELRVDVVQRAVDVKARTLGRSGHLLADAGVHALANDVAFEGFQHSSFFLPNGVARVLETLGFKSVVSDKWSALAVVEPSVFSYHLLLATYHCFTSRRSCRPSSSISLRCSGRPCSCTDRVCAATACRRPPGRPSGDRCR